MNSKMSSFSLEHIKCLLNVNTHKLHPYFALIFGTYLKGSLKFYLHKLGVSKFCNFKLGRHEIFIFFHMLPSDKNVFFCKITHAVPAINNGPSLIKGEVVPRI